MRWLSVVAVLPFLAMMCVAAKVDAKPAFWFAAVEPVHQIFPPDYLDLFAPNSPWSQAEGRLSIFKISSETVTHGTDDMIRTIFNGLRQRHLAAAVEMGALLQSPGEQCGGGEGYEQAHQINRLGNRLRALGFSLDYVAIDSPVWFGRERSWGVTKGRPDCQYSLDEIVHRASQTVAMMRQYFPAIRVGEIEAVNTRLAPGPVLADYAAFARGMRAATGQGLAFFHCDTAWQFPGWRAVLPRLQAQSHALGMRFGVIVGGSPEDATDEAWVEDGLQRLRELAPLLDDVVVQSWQKRPSRVLSETTAGSATYMLRKAEVFFEKKNQKTFVNLGPDQ